MKLMLDDWFGVAGYRYSQACRFSEFDTAWARDVVAMADPSGWIAARVEFFISTSQGDFASVQPYALREQNKWSSSWVRNGGPSLRWISEFRETLIHCEQGDVLTVLHPLSLVA
eukprot:9476524-Pyramimonas_sp.AAC.2